MSGSSSANIYRVGDYVYFESSHSSPYQIRRIEELQKTASGAVEAKVLCFFRRQDIPSTLITQADRHQIALEEEQELEVESLNDRQRHQMRHRELFFSRQIECVPANQIRGKCSVSLLNETELLSSYLDREDSFFYTLVYEPNQKTLLADRGEIRVGHRYQAEIPQKPLACPNEQDDRQLSKLETLIYTPDHKLTNTEIDQYLVVAKSIGTFARSLDLVSSVKQPNLHLAASAASRDITTQYAMDVLHKCNYDIGRAVLALCPADGAAICRDEMEEWSPSEASLFEDALDKYGRSFHEIQAEVLPWKSMRNLIEYYYFWKTSDRYVQQKRLKAIETENKLKQIYMPTSNSKLSNGTSALGQPAAVHGIASESPSTRPCDSCAISVSTQWHAWGQPHERSYLCTDCWTYWKKFGGLKYSSKEQQQKEQQQKEQQQKVQQQKEQNSTAIATGNGIGSPLDGTVTAEKMEKVTGNSACEQEYTCRECSKVFTRQERLIAHQATHRSSKFKCNICGREFRQKAPLVRHCQQAHGISMPLSSSTSRLNARFPFMLHTNPAIKITRRLSAVHVRTRRLARNPFATVDISQVKQESLSKLVDGQPPALSCLVPIKRGKLSKVSLKLDLDDTNCPDWLKLASRNQITSTTNINHKDQQLNKNCKFLSNDKESDKSSTATTENGLNGKKRIHEYQNGSDVETPSVPLKRRSLVAPLMNKQLKSEVFNQDGSSHASNLNGKIDDLFFMSNSNIKKFRKQLQPSTLKRHARRPWIKVAFNDNFKSSVTNSSSASTDTATPASS